MNRIVLNVLLATIPMVVLAAFTWRLVWPRWKLVAKLVLHPLLYGVLSYFIGHWSVAVAWIHQGVLGLGGQIWFSHTHGNGELPADEPMSLFSATSSSSS